MVIDSSAIVTMSHETAAVARNAYQRYGTGVGSPGVLTFGDYLANGIAMDLGAPLLFTGNDPAQPDVTAAAFCAQVAPPLSSRVREQSDRASGSTLRVP